MGRRSGSSSNADAVQMRMTCNHKGTQVDGSELAEFRSGMLLRQQRLPIKGGEEMIMQPVGDPPSIVSFRQKEADEGGGVILETRTRYSGYQRGSPPDAEWWTDLDDHGRTRLMFTCRFYDQEHVQICCGCQNMISGRLTGSDVAPSSEWVKIDPMIPLAFVMVTYVPDQDIWLGWTSPPTGEIRRGDQGAGDEGAGDQGDQGQGDQGAGDDRGSCAGGTDHKRITCRRRRVWMKMLNLEDPRDAETERQIRRLNVQDPPIKGTRLCPVCEDIWAQIVKDKKYNKMNIEKSEIENLFKMARSGKS